MNPAHPSHQPKSRPTPLLFGLLAALLFLLLALATIVLSVKVQHRDAQVAAAQKQLADAKAATSQANADLGAAKAANSQLQTQLDKANAQVADLQTQLDKAKDTGTQLQAQVEQDKAQLADLQVQLQKSLAHAADVEGQLAQATTGSRQLLTQLDQAQIQSLDLRSRLQKAESDLAQLQPLLLKARHLPVTTTWERVHGGRSFTLHLGNLYLQPLSVEITTSGPETGRPRDQSTVVGGGATLNIEDLPPGENVVIASEGYDPVRLIAR